MTRLRCVFWNTSAKILAFWQMFLLNFHDCFVLVYSHAVEFSGSLKNLTTWLASVCSLSLLWNLAFYDLQHLIMKYTQNFERLSPTWKWMFLMRRNWKVQNQKRYHSCFYVFFSLLKPQMPTHAQNS